MTVDEVTEMEAHPNLQAILQVRIWDDQGKIKGLPTPPFDHYAPLMQRVVDSHVTG